MAALKHKLTPDTRGGFLLSADSKENLQKRQRTIQPEHLPTFGEKCCCEECGNQFESSFLLSTFEFSVCDACRDMKEKHCLITRTEAKKEYLLKDSDLDDKEPPLYFITKPNPHNTRWGEMKLYLETQVAERALEVWGSEEALEAEQQKRSSRRENLKEKRYKKRLRNIQKALRVSKWKPAYTEENHTHEFSNEIAVDDDTFKATCKVCGFVSTYEKM